MRSTDIVLAASVIATASLGLAPDLGAQERGTKVVPDRPARVFVMAGFDAGCKTAAPVNIVIERQPAKGTVSLQAGQETTVQYSLSGKCVGTRQVGTGIYYTAAKGQTGTDTFSVVARIGSGEPATRTFTVQIAED